MPWRNLFLGLLAFGLGFLAAGSLERNARTKDLVALQQTFSQQSANALAAQKKEAERVLALVAELKPNADIGTLIREVENAQPTQLCVNAPAIVAVLERLRAQQAAKPGDREP